MNLRPDSGTASAPGSPQARQADQNPVRRNVGNTTSRAAAIAAMCAHCHGCDAEKVERGFRDEVRSCTARDCPLWHFRPFKEKAPDACDATEAQDISLREETSDEYTSTR